MLGTNMADAAGRANGTTLAASKTLNICVKPDGSWQYSGEFSVWNSGAVLTQGFDALDCIQTKVGVSSSQTPCQSCVPTCSFRRLWKSCPERPSLLPWSTGT